MKTVYPIYILFTRLLYYRFSRRSTKKQPITPFNNVIITVLPFSEGDGNGDFAVMPNIFVKNVGFFLFWY